MQDTAKPKELSVLIADDHNLLREVVAIHLAANEGVSVEQASTLTQALDKINAAGDYDIVVPSRMIT